MRLVMDYLALRRSFPDKQEGDSFPVTLVELSEALYCTPRNVKNIFTKMIEFEWIHFEPGRGRGHTSHLTFFVPTEELLFKQAVTLSKEGGVNEAFHFLNECDAEVNVKEQFVEWLSGYFGYEVAEQENQRVETLRIPIYRPINTLDPAECFYSFDANISKQIFDTLVRLDTISGKIKGVLAFYWKSNEDATSWIVYIHKGVRFHHGKELQAEDVVFTFNRLLNHFPRQNWLIANIHRVTALSKHVVRFDLHQPNHLFMQYLAYTPASIIASDTTQIVGTGPFKLVKKTKGLCVLQAFEDYFRGRAHIDVVEIINIPETKNEFLFCPDTVMVRTGEGEKEHIGQWEELQEFVMGSSLMTINQKKKGPLSDMQFRQALNHLIDRRKLLMDLGEPRFHPSRGFHVNMRPSLSDKDYWGQRAVELLRSSSYCGELLTIYTYERHAPDANWIKEYLADYGIRIEPTIVSWIDMQNIEFQDQADFILFEAVMSEGEVPWIELFQSGYSFIRRHMCLDAARDIDRMLNEMLSKPTKEERQHSIHDVEKRLRDSYSFIFLVHKNITTTFHPTLKGVRVNEKGWFDFKDLWFDNVEF